MVVYLSSKILSYFLKVKQSISKYWSKDMLHDLMIVWKTKGNSCNVQVTEKRFVVFNITLKVNKLYPFNLYLTINYSYFYLISGMFGIVQLMFWYIKNKNNWQREDKLSFLLCFTWIYFKNITKTNLLLYIHPYLLNQTCFYFILSLSFLS